MPDQSSSAMLDLGILKLVPARDGDRGLFSLYHPQLETPLLLDGPVFEINGSKIGSFHFLGLDGDASFTQTPTPGGGRVLTLRCCSSEREDITLTVELRSFADSTILRFRYRLTSAQPFELTKSTGVDNLLYFRLSQPGQVFAAMNNGALAEYQLSHFDSVQHSYLPYRADYVSQDLLPGMRFVGPVALFHTTGQTVLAAYEHGADHPDSFFDFSIVEDSAGRALELSASKGNYYDGQKIGGAEAWESAWFEVGFQPDGLEAFLPRYRHFFLEEVCEDRESRQPYIYYNTWNYQERQRYFKGRPYLESMNAERMLAEIDVAHQMGIDVFVIDTGWYKKTGDWLPNLERFPEGLKEIKRRLDEYGMKLGLWFNPTVAALTSRVFTEHPEWEMSWQGKPRWRGPIWETEESASMCLASDYVDYYIDVMVRLHQELGVSYFKWDAVSQYGCDSPNHQHGTAANSPAERADCYAFQMGISMIRIVEEVTRRCPWVIVDFDITEGGRFVGLGFLSAGKYFLVNNGPYFHEFNIPKWVKIVPDTINVFFYPGPARPRICRTGARFDELIPSILFLTHYLPDSPLLSQRNSIAALVLGGNGFWGDLPALSVEDVRFLSGQIGLYKRVAKYLTSAFPRVRGFAGSSPEIHEKVTPEACSGAVVFFTVTPGTITHITQPLNLDCLGEVVGADAWEILDGRLKITVNLERDDARVVYLIPQEK
jgi:alpha-galactosidase